MYDVAGDGFTAEADVGGVLERHGPGVYAVQVWATVDGEPAVISGYSVFHQVELSEGYGRQVNRRSGTSYGTHNLSIATPQAK